MPSFDRCSGIILHLTSLPSPYGIGTLGYSAHEFAEFLSKSGQGIWQLLPLGPTGFGNSPYQSFSSFAGNPYLIDLDYINSHGFDLSTYDWGDSGRVDYGLIYSNRYTVLRRIFEREGISPDIVRFVEENSFWLPDYALFMAVKRHFGGTPWYEWPMDIRSRAPEAMEKYSQLLKSEIDLEYWIQYQFYAQLYELKEHCRTLGLKLMGDVPIYCALDSADVWARPDDFLLDEEYLPIEVAGVPPDYFSATGQLWGNPLYRWDRMKETGYSFWKRRISAAANTYDIIRLDHFRGFESYWSVPYGSNTAAEGKWNPGPGTDFIDMLRNSFPNSLFLAEDLGIITDEVRTLRKYSKMPGMAILSFAFDPEHESSYLPHNLEKNCVCYTGTHDNAPLFAMLYELSAAELKFINSYCGDFEGIIRTGMVSRANVFITQMQDWLYLGPESRMNTPGADRGCWEWRLTRIPDNELANKIRNLTQSACRCRKKEEKLI